MMPTSVSDGMRAIRMWGEITDSESAVLRTVLVDAPRHERLSAVTV